MCQNEPIKQLVHLLLLNYYSYLIYYMKWEEKVRSLGEGLEQRAEWEAISHSLQAINRTVLIDKTTSELKSDFSEQILEQYN